MAKFTQLHNADCHLAADWISGLLIGWVVQASAARGGWDMRMVGGRVKWVAMGWEG